MEPLSAVIERRLAAWGFPDLPLERELFAASEPVAIAAAVDAWCRAHLGAGVEEYVFFESSSGSVHGVRLVDGRAVVVKGHRAAASRAFLDAVLAVQAGLASSGYPAPRPLAGPVPAGSGHVTAEEMVLCDTAVDGHDPDLRRLLASGLAQFVALGRPYRDALAAAAHPMDVPADALYPRPHSARFDFAATNEGAEWIDDLAARARAVLRAGPDVPRAVVHGDWRIENVGIRAGRLAAVYDWDSVRVAPEHEALAGAATTFSVDWRRERGQRFPVPAEIGAFVGDYAVARGTPLAAWERKLAAAAIVASLAYGARCEHADRGRPPAGADSHRGLLREIGAALLDEGLAVLAG